MVNLEREELLDQIRDMREDGLSYNQISKILGVKISKIDSVNSDKGGNKHGKNRKTKA